MGSLKENPGVSIGTADIEAQSIVRGHAQFGSTGPRALTTNGIHVAFADPNIIITLER